MRKREFSAVSILVLLEVPLRPSLIPAPLPENSVSILVLLEVPLRPFQAKLLRKGHLEFQSLFCWKFLLGRW